MRVHRFSVLTSQRENQPVSDIPMGVYSATWSSILGRLLALFPHVLPRPCSEDIHAMQAKCWLPRHEVSLTKVNLSNPLVSDFWIQTRKERRAWLLHTEMKKLAID